MAEAQNYTFDYKEIVEALIKKQGIHEGIWGIYMEFGLAGVIAGPSDEALFPAALVPVVTVGIQRFDTPTNLTIDAAEANPLLPEAPETGTTKRAQNRRRRTLGLTDDPTPPARRRRKRAAPPEEPEGELALVGGGAHGGWAVLAEQPDLGLGGFPACPAKGRRVNKGELRLVPSQQIRNGEDLDFGHLAMIGGRVPPSLGGFSLHRLRGARQCQEEADFGLFAVHHMG
jgi:hypothetical protein